MASLENIPNIESTVRRCVEERRMSYAATSEELKSMYPAAGGLSARSVRRFCAKHGIRKTSRLSDDAIDRLVSAAVRKVQGQS